MIPTQVRAIALLALVLALTRCTLLSSLDDLGPGVRDAGGEGSASVDGAVGDGPSNADAAPNADGASDFCRGKNVLFCDSFDVSSDPAAGWDIATTNGDGKLGRDLSITTSAPASLYASNGVFTGGTSIPYAFLTKTFMLTPHALRYAFDLRVDQADVANSYIEVAGLGFGDVSGQKFRVDLNYGQGGMWLREKGPGLPQTDHPLSQMIAIGTWSHVDIALTLGAGANHATVTLDGVVVADTPLSSVLQSGTTQVDLGIAYVPQGSMGWKARFDGVTFDAQP